MLNLRHAVETTNLEYMIGVEEIFGRVVTCKKNYERERENTNNCTYA